MPAPGTYPITVAGVRRNLPVVEVAPGLSIAAFAMPGDVELVARCAEALGGRLRALPALAGAGRWALVCPEAKAVPLTHRLAEVLGHARYVVCRKGVKAYMRDPLQVEVRSITTPGTQRLVLTARDASWLRERGAVLVDDVVSTGATMRAMEALMEAAGVPVLARAAALIEGEGVPGVLALGRLPVWRDVPVPPDADAPR